MRISDWSSDVCSSDLLPLYLLGESMGGPVVLAALAGAKPPAVEGAVLVAPAVWARSTMPFHQRAGLWLGTHLFPWAKFSGRGLGIQDRKSTRLNSSH